MSENINRSDVTVNLKDVYGQTITDEVEITFYNQKVQRAANSSVSISGICASTIP